MATQAKRKKASKGSVQFKNTKGRLQIVFSYSVKEKGAVKRKRFYISTGYEDTPVNRYRVGDIVKELQRDIDYGEVDLTLQKYKPAAAQAQGVSFPQQGVSSAPSSTRFAYDLVELWEKYTEFKRPQCSPSTYAKDYKKHRNHIARLPSACLEDAIAIRNHLLSTLSTDAAKRCLTQIKACCNWAVDEGLIIENPFAAMTIKVPKGQSEDLDINPFSKEERDCIIQGFAEHPHYQHYTNYVRFLFFTGARPSEVIGLRWQSITDDAIRFEQSVVISEDGLISKNGLKTQAKRFFPINGEVESILKATRRQGMTCQPADLVFPSPKGKFIDQHNFASRGWKRVLEACHIFYRKPYQTRHTFISLCVAAGVSSILIARWTGTSSRMIDKHYGATYFRDITPPKLL